MNDSEQLRIAPELLAVLRAGVTTAIEHGAEFVAPPHLLLGLLTRSAGRTGDRRTCFRAIASSKPRPRRGKKLPEVTELAEAPLPDAERPPFVRYDTLAFRSRDGTRTLYLDGEAYHVFIEGARRADGVYRPKHLVYGFTAEAVKDRDLLSLFGTDPQSVTAAVDTF